MERDGKERAGERVHTGVACEGVHSQPGKEHLFIGHHEVPNMPSTTWSVWWGKEREYEEKVYALGERKIHSER